MHESLYTKEAALEANMDGLFGSRAAYFTDKEQTV